MKEPLNLLPGMMRDGRLCSARIAAFSLERPVMVLPTVGVRTMSGYAKRILEVAPPRFAFVRLSTGKTVAMEVVRRAAARMTGLALLYTNPLANPSEMGPVREAEVAHLMRGRLREVTRDDMKPKYRRMDLPGIRSSICNGRWPRHRGRRHSRANHARYELVLTGQKRSATCMFPHSFFGRNGQALSGCTATSYTGTDPRL